MHRFKIAVGFIGIGMSLSPLFALESLPLRVDGKIVASKSDSGAKGKEVDRKQLEIRVTSVSQKDPGVLEVKCTFYARNVKTNRNDVVENVLTRTLNLEKGEATMVTPMEDFKSVQDHYVKKGAGKRNVRKVEGSGHEYSGWGVVVYDKNKQVVGKAYSALHLDPANDKK